MQRNSLGILGFYHEATLCTERSVAAGTGLKTYYFSGIHQYLFTTSHLATEAHCTGLNIHLPPHLRRIPEVAKFSDQ